jgi:hypothetical protein
MTQTGHGALNDADIQILRQSPVRLLHDDPKNRGVVFLEEMRIDQSVYDRMGFVRVIFYFLSVVLEMEDPQKKGIIIVVNTKVSTIKYRGWKCPCMQHFLNTIYIGLSSYPGLHDKPV